MCKNNGVVILSFPPHCSHELQPLDRSVYGPLKKYVNSFCDSWMRNNPGKSQKTEGNWKSRCCQEEAVTDQIEEEADCCRRRVFVR